MTAMGRPALSEHTIAVSWLILGYLSSNPDAKDTVSGVEKWWLSGMEFCLDPKTVQSSLDHLVKLGWLVCSKRQGTGTVYGLNKDHREKLQQTLQCGPELR
jgi:hypothetical protein